MQEENLLQVYGEIAIEEVDDDFFEQNPRLRDEQGQHYYA